MSDDRILASTWLCWYKTSRVKAAGQITPIFGGNTAVLSFTFLLLHPAHLLSFVIVQSLKLSSCFLVIWWGQTFIVVWTGVSGGPASPRYRAT